MSMTMVPADELRPGDVIFKVWQGSGSHTGVLAAFEVVSAAPRYGTRFSWTDKEGRLREAFWINLVLRSSAARAETQETIGGDAMVLAWR